MKRIVYGGFNKSFLCLRASLTIFNFVPVRSLDCLPVSYVLSLFETFAPAILH